MTNNRTTKIFKTDVFKNKKEFDAFLDLNNTERFTFIKEICGGVFSSSSLTWLTAKAKIDPMLEDFLDYNSLIDSFFVFKLDDIINSFDPVKANFKTFCNIKFEYFILNQYYSENPHLKRIHEFSSWAEKKYGKNVFSNHEGSLKEHISKLNRELLNYERANLTPPLPPISIEETRDKGFVDNFLMFLDDYGLIGKMTISYEDQKEKSFLDSQLLDFEETCYDSYFENSAEIEDSKIYKINFALLEEATKTSDPSVFDKNYNLPYSKKQFCKIAVFTFDYNLTPKEIEDEYNISISTVYEYLSDFKNMTKALSASKIKNIVNNCNFENDTQISKIKI